MTAVEESRLDTLLSRIEARDRRSRRIAILTTVLPAALGICLIAGTTYQVRSLAREASTQRDAALQAQTALERSRGELSRLKGEKDAKQREVVALQQEVAAQTRRFEDLTRTTSAQAREVRRTARQIALRSKELRQLEADTAASAATMNNLLHFVAKTKKKLPDDLSDELDRELFPIDSSERVWDDDHGDPSTDDWYTETLYRSPTGLYFLYKETGMNTGDAGANYLALTWIGRKAAIAWARSRVPSIPRDTLARLFPETALASRD
jgi:hypothetical protein